MVITEAARVEQTLYTDTEVRRLRTAAVDEVPGTTDLDLTILIETVRAGAVIADYAVHAALRRTDEPRVVNYGYAMRTLWSRGDSGTGSATLGNLEAALITIASFAPTPSALAAPKSSKFVSVSALTEPPGQRTRELVLLGRSLATALEYSSIELAGRAQRPWAALENVNAVAQRAFDYDNFLGVAEPLADDVIEPIRAAASQVPEAVTLWARSARVWANRQPPQVALSGNYASHAAIGGAGIEALEVASPSDPGGIFTVWFGTDREPRAVPRQGFPESAGPVGTTPLWPLPGQHSASTQVRLHWQCVVEAVDSAQR